MLNLWGFDGNVKFLNNANYLRRIEVLNKEIQKCLAQLGLVRRDALFAKADLNYAL